LRSTASISRTSRVKRGSEYGQGVHRRGGRYQVYVDYYHELGLAAGISLEPLGKGAQKYRLPTEHFYPMIVEAAYDVGYYFPKTGWVRNPNRNEVRHTPWPEPVQRQWTDFVKHRRDLASQKPDVDRWLDSITYYGALEPAGIRSEVGNKHRSVVVRQVTRV